MTRLLGWGAIVVFAACGFIGGALMLIHLVFGMEALEGPAIVLIFINAVSLICWWIYNRFANRFVKPS